MSDGLRAGFMTLAGVGMMFYMSPQLAFVGLGETLLIISISRKKKYYNFIIGINLIKYRTGVGTEPK